MDPDSLMISKSKGIDTVRQCSVNTEVLNFSDIISNLGVRDVADI